MSTTHRDIDGLSPLQRAALALTEMRARLDAVERSRNEPVAVIGMGCRFPGGGDGPESFWRMLREGGSGIVEVPKDRWDVDAYYDPVPATPGKMYTRHGGFLSRVDLFDPGFFGVSAREAVSMDPQQRLLLEVSWETLENAGQSARRVAGSATGVYFGVSSNDYAQSIMRRRELSTIDLYFASGTPLNTLAGRVSYVLGLQGPSVALDTACSSSLVAVHLACQSLRNRECDMALAGGVNLMLAPETTVIICQNRMLAADGRCKTFDAAADGYVRGEGCGVIALKRLSDALADGDEIRALISGSAVNHDGQSSGFTVPNGTVQQALIRRALRAAGIEPADVSYVEAHGTGTSLGDPIEIGALGAVFAGPRDAPVPVGSVKTNIGHLESAAGIAGLIKVILALQNEEIPAHLNLERLNPHIAWNDLPVSVATARTPWRRGERRRFAGVSSFGVSGTNAHVVLSEAPARETEPVEAERPAHLLTLSAKTEPALLELAGRYARHIASHPSLSVADAAFTAALGRSHFAHRAAVPGRNGPEMVERLEALARGDRSAGLVRGTVGSESRTEVAFLFTGQGAQYPGMGGQLYETAPVFREALDRCAELLRPHLDRPLLSLIHPARGESTPLHDTQYTQPALFALEYALATLWRSWGIEPSIVLGHSVGEYVAACVAGVFGLEDGLMLIATRGRLMQALPRDGCMAAVFADVSRVAAAVESRAGEVAIAAINDPRNVVISGRDEAVRQIVAELAAEGIRSTRLNVSHAFHSPLMDPILDEFERVAAKVSYSVPRVDLVSNLTGEPADAAEVARPGYWRRHVREPVRFAASMRALEAAGHRLFLEVGPGTTLLAMGRKCVSADDAVWIPSLREGREDWPQLLEGLGRFYVRGVEVDWAGFDRPYAPRRVALPTYPFERHRYWVEGGKAGGPRGAETAPRSSEIVRLLDAGDADPIVSTLAATGAFAEAEWPLLTKVAGVLMRKHREGVADVDVRAWMHEVLWREIARRPTPVGQTAARDAWLIFADDGGVGRALARLFEESGSRCVLVDRGAVYERADAGFRIDPENAVDYGRLLEEATAAAGGRLRGAVHLWGLNAGHASAMTTATLSSAQREGTKTALLLLQALARSTGESRPRLWVATRGATPAAGSALDGPAQAPLWGLGRVIALECPDSWGGLVDLDPVGEPTGDEAAQLAAEILDPQHEDQVALRGDRRFAPRLVRIQRETGKPAEFDPDATYMITGGFGGLGGEVARWMVGRGARHLVLVGREGAATATAREAVSRLERSGASVQQARVDVADLPALRGVFDEIGATMAPLRGVIHAAGLIEDGILLQQEWSRFETVFRPKVDGAWNLHILSRDLRLDHFVLFSSMASVLGVGGQGNYAAANAFLDALAHHRQAQGLPALAVNWGPWGEVGIASRQVLAHVERRGIAAIPPEWGLRALDIALGSGAGQVAIVAADWPFYFEHVPAAAASPILGELVEDHASPVESGRTTRPKGAPRPHLQNDYVAPGDETEKRLAEIWAEELGIDRVGVNDNLFELGGDSLISIQIVNRVRRDWGKDISTIAVYESPTVGSFARILADGGPGAAALDDSDVRAKRRRTRVASRQP